jgi:anti-anti-sigma regulatory factor
MRVDAHTLAVDQLRLGDHAFADYGDDAVRWELSATFAVQGIALGHKVMVLLDPAVSRDDARERIVGYGAAAERALVTGQLKVTSMRELTYPERRFSTPEQAARLREETEQAKREGYGGLRVYIDMAWIKDLGPDIEGVMRRETDAAGLFAHRDYAEVCHYDRRYFASEVMEAMWAVHPVALLERPGDLATHGSSDGWHLIGDADLATRQSFRSALRVALDAASGRGALLDLSRLCFLSAGCAGDLLRLTAGARCDRVVVRCSPVQARTLRRLGASRLPELVLDEIGDPR